MVPGTSLDEVEIGFEEESGTLDYNATLDSYGEDQSIQYLVFNEKDPTYNQIISSWIDKAIDDLRQLKKLSDNWDSYGSPKISIEVIQIAEDFLRNLEYEPLDPPFVVPVSGGSLQLEWQKGNRELEIEFINSSTINYLKVVNDQPLDEGNYYIKNNKKTFSLIRWLIYPK
jgi:hypothetical protein